MDRKKNETDEEEDAALLGTAPIHNMLDDEDPDPMEDTSLPIDEEETL